MSKRVKFFYNGILLTLVGFAMRAAGLFLSAYISGAIGAEGVGLSGLITTVYAFAVTFATSGISLTVTRLVASAIGEGREDRVGGILRSAFLYSLVFGALATFGLFKGANYIGLKLLGDDRTATSLRILAFSLIPAALSSVLAGYFVGVKRVAFNAVATVFCQLVKMAVTVALLFRLAPYGMVNAVAGLCLGISLTETIGCLLIFIEFLF